jgi:Tfp pilus tip-associated adhesin PilY1
MFGCGMGVKIDGTCACDGGGGSGTGGVTVQVGLPDNAHTRVNIPSTNKQGSYTFIVKSVLSNGATGTFNTSSSQDAVAGSVVRVTDSKSITNERVQQDWQPNQVPQLFHQVLKMGGTGAIIFYNVTIFTNP